MAIESIDPAFLRLDGVELSSGHTLRVTGVYSGGQRPSIMAFDPDGIPECHITHNLPNVLGPEEFFVRLDGAAYSPAVFAALRADGIAEPTGRVVRAGYVARYAEAWRLCPRSKPPWAPESKNDNDGTEGEKT